MKLKIIGDGTPQGSRVVIAETGETVENVEFVELSIDAKNGVNGTIRFLQLQVDIEFTTPGVTR